MKPGDQFAAPLDGVLGEGWLLLVGVLLHDAGKQPVEAVPGQRRELIELVKFVETMLLTGHSALSPEPWRGASEVEQRLPAEVQAELRAALPAAPEPEELRRAFDVALQRYLRLRQQLSTERRMPLAQDLARQVFDRIGPR